MAIHTLAQWDHRGRVKRSEVGQPAPKDRVDLLCEVIQRQSGASLQPPGHCLAADIGQLLRGGDDGEQQCPDGRQLASSGAGGQTPWAGRASRSAAGAGGLGAATAVLLAGSMRRSGRVGVDIIAGPAGWSGSDGTGSASSSSSCAWRAPSSGGGARTGSASSSSSCAWRAPSSGGGARTGSASSSSSCAWRAPSFLTEGDRQEKRYLER